MARGGGSRGGSSGGGGGRGFSGGSSGGRGGTGSGLGGGRGLGGSSGSRPTGGGNRRGGGRPTSSSSGGGGGVNVRFYGTPRRSRSYGRRRRGGYGGGCLSVMAVAAVVLIMVVVFFLVIPSGNSVTPSTKNREPLPRGSAVETDYFTDELGWIGNRTQLLVGMKNFYDRTGVQPHLYINDNVNGSKTPTNEEVERFAEELYDKLFDNDHAHLLLLFIEFDSNTSDYLTWYQPGYQARSVVDIEAGDILLDYIDLYYYQRNLTDEEVFSKAFDSASKRIMEVTKSPWITVWIIFGVLAVLLVLFLWWNSSKKKKAEQDERDERILNTPLEAFGDDEASRRAKGYDDNNKK